MYQATASGKILRSRGPWLALTLFGTAILLGARAAVRPRPIGGPPAEMREDRRWESFSIGPVVIAGAYLAVLVAAECLTALVDARIGAGLHVALLMALLVHASLMAGQPYYKLLLALTLPSLVRILSLSMPLEDIHLAYWYAIIAFPVVMAAFLVARTIGLSRRDIGLSMGFIPFQLLIATSGVGLGVTEYLILRPEPLIETLRWQTVLVPALTLMVGTGFSEELLFRGVMQSASRDALGKASIFYVSAVFAVLHIGHRSALDVVFVFGVGLLFAWVVAKGGSILGVSLAHGLTNICLYLVVPFMGLAGGSLSVAAEVAPPAVVAPVAAVASPGAELPAWEATLEVSLAPFHSGPAEALAAVRSRASIESNWAGPTSLRDIEGIAYRLIPRLLGGAEGSDPANYQLASPLRNLTMG